MFLRNIIMAIVLALFFLCYLSALAKAGKEVTEDKQGVLILTDLIKKIFLGSVLCTILTLLGLTSFCFGDTFICICIVIFLDTVG